MQEAVPLGEGAMAAVHGLGAETVEQACIEVAEGDVVCAANLNAPMQIAISGHTQAVDRASIRLRECGARRVLPLPVSAPFHCALMKPAEMRLAKDLKSLVVRNPSVPVVVNVDAMPKRTSQDAVEALIKQVSAPVRWVEVVRWLIDGGVTAFIEVGPGRVLSGLIKKIDRRVCVANVEDPESLESAQSVLIDG